MRAEDAAIDCGAGAAGPTPAHPEPTADAEIAAIEQRMATDRAGYFADKPQQARYRALVAARQATRTDAIATTGPAAVSVNPHASGEEEDSALDGPLGQLAESWRVSGDFAARVAQGCALLSAMDAHLGATSVSAFTGSIDGLPDAVQAAFAEEAAMPPWGGRASSVDPAVLKAFTDSPEFASLVRAWHGPDSATTARKVAILNTRLGRVLNRLKPDDRATALDWWEKLPGRAAAALVWNLTGGTR